MELFECTQPWFEMQIRQSGKQIRCCCFWGGKVDEWDSSVPFEVESYWNSLSMQQLREVVRSNRPSNTACQSCQALKYAYEGLFKEIPQGLNSRQQNNWQNALSNYEKKNLVVDSYPVRYAFDFGMACQLDCVMCCQENERKRDKGQLPLDWLLDMKEHLILASEFLIWGGEPFVIPHARRFIETIISDPDYQDIQLRFITNGMLLHQWINPLQSMKRIHLKVSVDAIGKTYEAIRRGATWNVVERNILAVKELIDKNQLDWQVKMTSLIMKSSIPSMVELTDWAIQHDIPIHWLPVGAWGYPVPQQEAVFQFPQLLETLPQWEELFNESIQKLTAQGWIKDSAFPLSIMREELRKKAVKHHKMVQYCQAGRESYQKGDLAKAEQTFQGAESLAYPEPGLVMELGKVYADLHLHEHALNCFRNVAARLSEFPNAYYQLGHVLAQQGHLEEAIAYYQHALSLNPHLVEIYGDLSQLFHNQGRIQEALACQERARQNRTVPNSQVIYCIGENRQLGENMIKAYLFDDYQVSIDPRAATVGGSWQGEPRHGLPTTWEMSNIKFFYEKALAFEYPTILDIGANTGSFCLLPKLNPHMKCYAFEPTPHIFEILEKNVLLNGLQEQVSLFRIALADKKGTTILKFPKSGIESGLACLGKPLRFNDWIEIEVPMTTLDDLSQEEGIINADLVKIDTEGCELFVLKGAENFIRTYQPGLLLEYHRPNTLQFSYEPEEILKLLFSWGYKEYKKISASDLYFERPKKTVSKAKTTVFDEGFCKEISQARLNHLASLGISFAHTTVLEVGSGVGHLTEFFEKLGCSILSTDARPENVAEHRRRYPHRKVKIADLSIPGNHDGFGSFDIIFCYGTLYHLATPDVTLAELAKICKKTLLLETCVHPMENGEVNFIAEPVESVDQSFHGRGCRPARDWIFSELKKFFPFVYVTATQPNHPDYPLTWPAPPLPGHNTRAVFVASREALPLPTLLDQLPKQQHYCGSIPNELNFFREWINTLAKFQNRLYYRDQTPESLNTLVEVVQRYQPTKIIELGTLFGLSLRTWLSTNTSAEIIAIDLSFSYLFQSQSVIPIDLSRIKLLEQDILKINFHQLWTAQDRVLLYIDAHDQPEVPIMEYLLVQVVPFLPKGSVVVVDDLWHSPMTLSQENVQLFFEKVVTHEMDPLHVFEGYYAPYWQGGSFLGFAEVIPLMKWANQHQVKLQRNPGVKSVWFEKS